MSIIIYNKFCYFTSILEISVELVNLVNYKVYMNDKSNSKRKGDKSQMTEKEGHARRDQLGVYLRDDHCDWGSSGMNEYTKEFDNIQ